MDFQWVQSPQLAPGRCQSCSTHSHPDGFVDLIAEGPLQEVPGFGLAAAARVYLCAGCLRQAARHVGCLEPKQADDLGRRLGEANSRINQLEADLAAEQENKLVSLADVRELVRQRGGRPAKEPAA